MKQQTKLDERVRVAPETTVKTKTRLAPELVQNLQVLVMTAAELETYVAESAERNPLLEVDYDNELFSFEALPSEDTYESAAELFADTRVETPEFFARSKHMQKLDAGPIEWDFSRIQDDCAETETLQESLRLQSARLNLRGQAATVMNALIECVSDDGYFSGTVEQVAFETGADLSLVDAMLTRLQSFKPTGVGSRTLSECLLAQIEKTEPLYDLLVDLVENGLADLADGRLGQLAREHGVSSEVMAQALAVLRSLNPRPGAEFYQKPDFRYVVPDIVVRVAESGSFEARVLGASQPCLVLNKDYMELLGSGRLTPEERSYLESRSAEASSVLRGIDARNGMLQQFASLLLKRQARYFVTRGQVLAPMTMQEVADELGVHVSTVSRAVNGKYLQVPWGCVPLKSLFTRALPKTNGDIAESSVSSSDVKSQIAFLIGIEPKDNPYSDAKLCQLLNDRGIEIKRRTVAKYRMALGIGSQSARKWDAKARTEASC